MKRSALICAITVTAVMALAGSAQATIETGAEEWRISMNEPFTCVAFYLLGEPEFTQLPILTDTYPWPEENPDWQAGLSDDNKIAYFYGPELTNVVFNLLLNYQWDTEADEFDPDDLAVSQDMALFNGATLLDDFGVKFTPENPPGNWELGAPLAGDDVVYTNPAIPIPEPATMILLGLGGFLFRRKR